MQVKSLILVGTLEKYQFLILMIPKVFLTYGVGDDRERFAEFRQQNFSFLFAQTFLGRTHVRLFESYTGDCVQDKLEYMIEFSLGEDPI
ncbi:hypothetical protein LEP1GSC051_3055 [Leptospira sp. P2653]|nr:hypothetical protein LEP1GSC051_3055 [Leptospira sp. P2653]